MVYVVYTAPKSLETQPLEQNFTKTASENEWKEYNATIGNFKMLFPDVPTVDTQNYPATDKSLAYTYTVYLSAPNKKVSYAAGVMEYSSDTDTSNLKENLTNAVNGAVVNTKGILISSGFTTFKNYTVIDSVMKSEEGIYIRSRMFIVGRTLYILESLSLENSFPDFDKFADSFQLLEQ